MRTKFLIFILCFWVPDLLSQCVPLFQNTPRISDRYIDATRMGANLILVNGHGMVIGNADAPKTSFVREVSVAGEITAIHKVNHLLILPASGAGIHVYSFRDSQELPVPLSYKAIENLSSIAVFGNAVFAQAGAELHYFKIADDGNLMLQDSIQQSPLKFIANEESLFLLEQDRSVTAIQYNSSGFGSVNPLVLGNNAIFYDIHHNNGLLVLDGLDGIRWVDVQDNKIKAQGYLFHNQEQGEVALSATVDDQHVFIRFSNRLAIYRLDANHKLSLHSNIPASFEEIGTSLVKPMDDLVMILNTATNNRNWAARLFQIKQQSINQIMTVDAGIEDLTSAAQVGQHTYLADSATVYRVNPGLSLVPVFHFDGLVSDIAGTDDYLFVISSLPMSGSRVQIFAVNPAGNLQLLSTEEYRGSLSGLSHFQNNIAFMAYYRDQHGDQYSIQVLRHNGSGFQKGSVTVTDTISGLQLSELGLTYHDGTQIFSHHSLNLLHVRSSFNPEVSQIKHVVANQGHLWVESPENLKIFKMNGPLAQLTGQFNHWFDLEYISGGHVLARSLRDFQPTNFHLLNVDDQGRAFAQYTFSTSTKPLFIHALEEDILLVEKTAVNLYRFRCAEDELAYLMPLISDFELELTTLIEAGDVVQMFIYNRSFDLIGTQRLDADLISQFNGKRIYSWLFDYNQLEDPNALLLTASKPLAPVISGIGGESQSARFAYMVSPISNQDLYLPHLPNDQSIWDTYIFVSSQNQQDQARNPLQIENASGDQFTRESTNLATEVFRVGDDAVTNGSPWLKVSSNDLNAQLSGFTLLVQKELDQAAALPLIQGLSDFLIIPTLGHQFSANGWTGVVVTNPHEQQVQVRVQAYANGGDLLHESQITIDPQATYVTIAEDLLGSLSDQVHNLMLLPEVPLTGMLLYGNGENSMAALPLNDHAGQELLFSGIRVTEGWRTRFFLTNVDHTQFNASLTAYDHKGKFIGTRVLNFRPKQSRQFELDRLFEGLPAATINSIKTLKVENPQRLSGFILRSVANTKSLEAVSALVQSEAR